MKKFLLVLLLIPSLVSSEGASIASIPEGSNVICADSSGGLSNALTEETFLACPLTTAHFPRENTGVKVQFVVLSRNNTNSKTIRLRLGGTIIATWTNALANQYYNFEATILKVNGFNSQKSLTVTYAGVNGGTAIPSIHEINTGFDPASGISLTGTGHTVTLADDLIYRYMIVTAIK